jgi:hypothetical protein
MGKRVPKTQSRRWNRIDLLDHWDCTECPDPKHAKYVSNARALLLLTGDADATQVLLCGCPFFAIRLGK